MEQTLTYKPQNVCARGITIVYEDGIVKKVSFLGGCAGNTQGVARLAEGRSVEELIALLDGIKCQDSRTHQTSCPDQLAAALKTIR